MKTILANTLLILLGGLLHCSIQASNKINTKTTADTKIKNVILIIGDGMGPGQIGLLEAYARQSSQPTINRVTAFSRMLKEGAVLGMSITHAANVMSTDSAASATQLATGKSANPETVGIDAKGYSSKTLVDIAKENGKATGLVSDVRITHSTPASFAAHQSSRTLENEIAIDMLQTGTDVMLSGGLRHWIPEQANDKSSKLYQHLTQLTEGAIKITSKRTDQRNLLNEAEQQGYQLAFTKQQLLKTTDSGSGKILGLFSHSTLPNGIANTLNSKPDIPTLKEMSSKAISVLEKNEQGFFLMIESGLIDWAAHDNDTGRMLHEMLKINEALHYVLDWAADRDDTLIIVTADHETGGFGFSYSASQIPKSIDLPGEAFQDKPYQSNFNYGSTNILDKLYNQKLSYDDIFSVAFDSLESKDKTPQSLMKIVNKNTDFSITEKQAARILETTNNDYYVKDHRYLSSKTVPKIAVNDAFFVYQLDDNRRNLLAFEVAEKQSVVWSNGTHTATPVLVFVKGEKRVSEQFINILTHPELGKKVMNILGDKDN